jgi:hypothetical protein
MARIKCKTPSTGRAINLTSVNLSTEWTTIAEAPDFSVPDTSNSFPARDPADATRAIRPGEIFFLTPLFARNKTVQSCWIEVRLVLESGATIDCPGRMYVPALDTSFAPLQGRSLVKRIPGGMLGDRIQARAQTAEALDLWISGEEKLSSEHIGVVA